MDLHVIAIGWRQSRPGEISLAGKTANELIRRFRADNDIDRIIPVASLRRDPHRTNKYQYFEHIGLPGEPFWLIGAKLMALNQ